MLLQPTPATLTDVSRRFGWIIALLCRGIAGWSPREPGFGALVRFRVGRHIARVQAILAGLAEGRLPRLRPPRPRRPEPEAAAPPDPPPPAPPAERRRYRRLPRKPGWLMASSLETRGAASQLRAWLADPAVRDILAEVPQARQPLAALCRMLAIPPWPHPPDGPLPEAPRRQRPSRPRPRKPRPPPEPAFVHRSLECDAGLRSATRPWWMPPKNRR